MPLRRFLVVLSLLSIVVSSPPSFAVEYDRTSNVIYGRSYGTSWTMEVFRPVTGSTGAGAEMVASGGYVASPERISPLLIELYTEGLLQRGYVVFIVVHGSTPKFTVPEAVADVNRAIRFIRHHGGDYGVDPDRLGAFGTSAGGHLALMVMHVALAATGVPARLITHEGRRHGWHDTRPDIDAIADWFDEHVLDPRAV